MLFGTDGIRGRVNLYPMTPDMIVQIGMAAGYYFGDRIAKNHKTKVVIAKDTRLSGYLLEPALTSGLVSVGTDVVLVGPMPTPALSMLVPSLRADFGIMITASHNPYHDNGIKIFDKNGFKLSDDCQKKIQDLITNFNSVNDNNVDLLQLQHRNIYKYFVSSDHLGRVSRLDDAVGRYIENVKRVMPKNSSLQGIRIVIDCANGAGYKVAPTIFQELDAEVISFGCQPNGTNINHSCGSMHPSFLAKKVIENKADIGIALDGDGDRLLVCDENGTVVHGDVILAMIAKYMMANNMLKQNDIVVTEISNRALDNYMATIGIRLWRSKVGDRNVAAEMRKRNCNFGGEQSGHIICSDYSTSSDGIVASLFILSIMLKEQRNISSIAKIFSPYPQLHNSVSYASIDPLTTIEVQSKIREIQKNNDNLRIIVRKSGTEKIIRIMVEGRDLQQTEQILNEITLILQSHSL